MRFADWWERYGMANSLGCNGWQMKHIKLIAKRAYNIGKKEGEEKYKAEALSWRRHLEAMERS